MSTPKDFNFDEIDDGIDDNFDNIDDDIDDDDEIVHVSEEEFELRVEAAERADRVTNREMDSWQHIEP